MFCFLYKWVLVYTDDQNRKLFSHIARIILFLRYAWWFWGIWFAGKLPTSTSCGVAHSCRCHSYLVRRLKGRRDHGASYFGLTQDILWKKLGSFSHIARIILFLWLGTWGIWNAGKLQTSKSCGVARSCRYHSYLVHRLKGRRNSRGASYFGLAQDILWKTLG